MDDLISRKAAIDALFKLYEYQRDIDPTEAADLVRQGVYLAEKKIEQLPSAQQDSKETSPTHKALDTISRQAAIDALTSHIMPHNNEDGTVTIGVLSKSSIKNILNKLPSAQPETHEERTETHACDLIERQAAIDAMEDVDWYHINSNGQLVHGANSKEDEPLYKAEDVYNVLNDVPSAQPEHTNSCYTNSWCIDCKEYDKEKHSCPRFNRVIKQTLDEVYAHAETEAEARYHAQQRWIPCSERLPEERQEILATTTDNAWGDVVIIRTYYKEMHKSVIAWMPLPEPYAERRTDEHDDIFE